MGELTVINKLGELTVEDLYKVCEEEGVTVRDVCKLLKEGMGSNTIGKVNNEGNMVESSVQADMPTRHKYMQSAIEVLRMVTKQTVAVGEVAVTHKMAPEDIDRLESIAKELKALEGRLSKDKLQQGQVIDAVINTHDN